MEDPKQAPKYSNGNSAPCSARENASKLSTLPNPLRISICENVRVILDERCQDRFFLGTSSMDACMRTMDRCKSTSVPQTLWELELEPPERGRG